MTIYGLKQRGPTLQKPAPPIRDYLIVAGYWTDGIKSDKETTAGILFDHLYENNPAVYLEHEFLLLDKQSGGVLVSVTDMNTIMERDRHRLVIGEKTYNNYDVTLCISVDREDERASEDRQAIEF